MRKASILTQPKSIFPQFNAKHLNDVLRGYEGLNEHQRVRGVIQEITDHRRSFENYGFARPQIAESEYRSILLSLCLTYVGIPASSIRGTQIDEESYISKGAVKFLFTESCCVEAKIHNEKGIPEEFIISPHAEILTPSCYRPSVRESDNHPEKFAMSARYLVPIANRAKDLEHLVWREQKKDEFPPRFYLARSGIRFKTHLTLDSATKPL